MATFNIKDLHSDPVLFSDRKVSKNSCQFSLGPTDQDLYGEKLSRSEFLIDCYNSKNQAILYTYFALFFPNPKDIFYLSKFMFQIITSRLGTRSNNINNVKNW